MCTVWLCRKSPADWGHFRDRTLSTLTWSVEGQRYGVIATGEPHLWKIVNVEQGEQPTCGYVSIYVDDVLATGEEAVRRGPYFVLSGSQTVVALLGGGMGDADRMDKVLWL